MSKTIIDGKGTLTLTKHTGFTITIEKPLSISKKYRNIIAYLTKKTYIGEPKVIIQNNTIVGNYPGNFLGKCKQAWAALKFIFL
jgi:hypothetical protein